jgi:alanyl-tRNA synthetase
MIGRRISDGELKADAAIVAQHALGRSPSGWLNGRKIFELHDTFGLPFSTIREECKIRGAAFDESGIRAELRIRYGWSREKIEAELRE